MSLVLNKLRNAGEPPPLAALTKPDTRRISDAPLPQGDTVASLWRKVDAVVRRRQTDGLSYDELARLYRCTEQEIERWCRNAEGLKSMSLRRGKPRHRNSITVRKGSAGAFPTALHLSWDQAMAVGIFEVVDRSRPTKRQRLLRCVVRFVRTFNTAEGGVECSTLKEIRDYVRLLSDLAIPMDQIRVVRVLPRARGVTAESESARLEQKLRIPATSIVPKTLQRAEYSRSSEYYVKVVHRDLGREGRCPSAYGFRFAMYLLAIIHDLVSG